MYVCECFFAYRIIIHVSKINYSIFLYIYCGICFIKQAFHFECVCLNDKLYSEMYVTTINLNLYSFYKI